MKPELGGWTVVLAGAWNKAIFNPAWIAKEVFGESEEIPVELAIAFGVDERLMKFPTKSVEFRVSSSRIIVAPTDLEDDSLQTVSASVETVVQVLRHTPITAIGFNFVFTTDEPEEALRQTLSAPDAEYLLEKGLTIGETKSAKMLAGVGVQGEPTLNLTLKRDHSTNLYSAEFNYHYARNDIPNIEKSAIIALRDHAITVLQAYGETVESESE